jgi:hypothetical protein
VLDLLLHFQTSQNWQEACNAVVPQRKATDTS